MTGYKVMKQTRMCFERTDRAIMKYRAFATMWQVPDNLLHVFFNINAPFGSDHFVLISQHNFGEKLLYSHFPPIWKGGRNGYIAIFPGGESTI